MEEGMKKWNNEGSSTSLQVSCLALLLAEYRTNGQKHGRAVSLDDVKGVHSERTPDLESHHQHMPTRKRARQDAKMHHDRPAAGQALKRPFILPLGTSDMWGPGQRRHPRNASRAVEGLRPASRCLDSSFFGNSMRPRGPPINANYHHHQQFHPM